MEEEFDKINQIERTDREEIFSRCVRAGKRTYFFDVKATRRNDFYLTLTESKKRTNKDGRFYYEKHKIFLYKEDFDKFTDVLSEVIEYIKNLKADAHMEDIEHQSEETEGYTNVEFEDLESVEASEDMKAEQ